MELELWKLEKLEAGIWSLEIVYGGWNMDPELRLWRMDVVDWCLEYGCWSLECGIWRF